MTATDRATLWIVYNGDRDDTSVLDSAFTDKDTAKAYAKKLGLDVAPVRVYGAGDSPTLIEAWRARALVSPTIVSAPHVTGPWVFGDNGYAPTWVKQPCELSECSVYGSGLEIAYHGNDRDAVLAACQARFDKAVAAMVPDGVAAQ